MYQLDTKTVLTHYKHLGNRQPLWRIVAKLTSAGRVGYFKAVISNKAEKEQKSTYTYS